MFTYLFEKNIIYKFQSHSFTVIKELVNQDMKFCKMFDRFIYVFESSNEATLYCEKTTKHKKHALGRHKILSLSQYSKY